MQDLVLGVSFGICSPEIMLNCFYFISASWKQLFPKSFHGHGAVPSPLTRIWVNRERTKNAIVRLTEP